MDSLNLRRKVSTAVTWGKDPIDILYPNGWAVDGDKKTVDQFMRELNVRLMEAWQILQDETCSSCGQVSWYARNPDRNINLDIHDSTCESCAAIAREEEERNKNKRPTPKGTTLFTRAKAALKELPTRMDWLHGRVFNIEKMIYEVPEY